MSIRKVCSFVFVTLACVLAASGQGTRQVYQVCSSSTAESRFVYHFKPRTVVLEQGQNLDVEISRGPNKYLEQDTRRTNRSNNATVGGQDIVGQSDIRDYPRANIHFEQPLTEVSLPSEGWSAIVLPSNEGSAELATASERYIFPPQQNRVPVGTITPGNSVVMGRLDMASMPVGGYWITLMNTATIAGQADSSCVKTTPPVYVKIVPKSQLQIAVASNQICKDPNSSLSITASTVLVRNGTTISSRPENVVYEWQVTKNGGGEVTLPDPKTFQDGQKLTLDNLEGGEYEYRVRVTDSGQRSDEMSERILVNDCTHSPLPSNSGAGMVYFGFDVPYGNRDIGDYKNPETWVECEPRVARCTSGYPASEFEDFYDKTGLKGKKPGFVDTNTNKLNNIIATLNRPENKALKLWIIGYADFKADDDYNTDLVGRRVAAVRDYLSGNGLADRIAGQQVAFKNESNRLATTCECDNSALERRWDRRVEIIYIKDGDEIHLPSYSTHANCPKDMCSVHRRTARQPPTRGKKSQIE